MCASFSYPRLDLNGDWQLAVADGRREITSLSQLESSGLQVLEARVPGNFELDLQRNGLIEEPFHGLNIIGLRSYEHSHFWFARRFEAQAREGHEAWLHSRASTASPRCFSTASTSELRQYADPARVRSRQVLAGRQ
jgi:hypothetical protein